MTVHTILDPQDGLNPNSDDALSLLDYARMTPREKESVDFKNPELPPVQLEPNDPRLIEEEIFDSIEPDRPLDAAAVKLDLGAEHNENDLDATQELDLVDQLNATIQFEPLNNPDLLFDDVGSDGDLGSDDLASIMFDNYYREFINTDTDTDNEAELAEALTEALAEAELVEALAEEIEEAQFTKAIDKAFSEVDHNNLNSLRTGDVGFLADSGEFFVMR